MTRRCPWKKGRPAATPPPPSSFVRAEHEFRIVGYSTASENHYSILSGAFQIGGHTWALDCGFNMGEHLVIVFLELLTPYIAEDLVVAKAGLRIEDPLGRFPAIEWRSEEPHTFTTGSRSWKLSVPDEFHGNESRYVQHDRLTILCTVEVLQEEHDSTIADDIRKLLLLPSEPEPKSESERRRHACMLPDVTFIVEQTEIPAHRLVLALRSPVFAAELLGEMRESTARRVRVDDMRASTFRAMIRFIYTDELPIKAITYDASQRACKDKCAAKRHVAMACDLLVAADRYDLEKLRLMCEEVLYESMDAASVLPTLLVAHGRYNCRQLEASCIDYLASDADVYAFVIATDEYMKLEESCNSLVVEVMNKVATQKLADSSSSFDTARNPRRTKKMSVSTYDASKVVSGTHEMRIPSFVALYRKKRRTYGVGREIQSNTFEIDGYDWKLVVDPAGKNPENEECVYVAAELLTDPGTAGVRASVCFWMDDPNGQDEPTEKDYEQHIFTRYAQSYGNDVIATKDAEQRFLAHDGSLTIRCSIIVTNNSCIATGTPTACGAGATPPSIDWHLKELLASEKGSDVTFLVENREIRAHKLLIAVRSPILYEMVVGVANKADHFVPVDDMKVAVFEAMLHFIYTGELPPMEHLALATSTGTKDISFAMKEITLASNIMTAACRFSLDKMKAKCVTLLAGSIKKENAESMLTLARQHSCSKLEDYCAQFLLS
ncbi:uncharacterized protein LOC124664199 [Lolium rigidum]|uniref:uncharacterized protein LOC124664199 n=1 Tax=Lolium rigidum TaxID=89674 RepID=UPI001F5DF53A|nr:uncharacterized protein LOC124664199 [Lolium rigidum]